MVLEGSEAIATLLVRIIELEPGTIPSHPEKGEIKQCLIFIPMKVEIYLKSIIKI